MNLRLTLLGDASPLSGKIPPSDVLLFPELVDGGYAALERGAGTHRIGDPYVALFQDASRKYGCTCVAGSVALRNVDGSLTNTSLAFRNGRCVRRYEKIHLFRPAGDHRFFRAGTVVRSFFIPVKDRRVRAGIIICYDLRFPELSRMLAREGIQLLLVPARWPVVRDDAWQTLLKARAIENQVFVAGCNAADSEGGFSYVFDPTGRLLFSSRQKPERRVHTVLLDLRLLHEARRVHRNIRDAVILRGATILTKHT
jgi:predicted amidohydrolase